MCRSTKAGGRRCPSANTATSRARAAQNRKLNKIARSTMVDYLRDQGMVDTAALLNDAPPSVLSEFLRQTGIDAAVLGDTRLPRHQPGIAVPQQLLDVAAAEMGQRAQHGDLSARHDYRAAADRAWSAAAQAAHHADAARRHLDNLTVAGDRPDIAAATAAYEHARAVADAAARHAEDCALAAYNDATTAATSEADRDRYCASLSPEQAEAVSRAAAREHADTVATAWGTALTVRERDLTVSEFGTHTFDDGATVAAQFFDGATVLYQHPTDGTYRVLTPPSGHHETFETHADAMAVIASMPVIEGIDAPPDLDATDLAWAADDAKRDLALQVLSRHGDLTLAHQQTMLATEQAQTAEALAYDHFGVDVRADIHDASKRHRQAQRFLNAEQRSDTARAAALAAGASTAGAAAASYTAYDDALSTPTRGGAAIPHFWHAQIPASIGEDRYEAATHSGLRPAGIESADDYPIIKQRQGDLVLQRRFS